MRKLSIVLYGLLLLSACTDRDEVRKIPNIDDITATVAIERLEETLIAQPTPEALSAWLEQNPILRDQLLGRENYVDPRSGMIDSAAFVEDLFATISHPTFQDTLYAEAAAEFANMDDIKSNLELAFRRLKAYDPDFVQPKVQTIVSAFTRDIFVSDSLWVISIDCYIGSDASYRPTGPGYQPLPGYLMRRYQREYIVPMLLKSYALKYIATDVTPNANSLLADMLGYGKTYEFTKSVLPELPDSLIIRYSGEELAGVEANEAFLWGHFIQNELLFEKNPGVISSYLDEAPNVPAISTKCPGRIGRWLGWQIVKEYRRKHPETTLVEIMEHASAQAMLEGARYKPE